MAYYLVTSSVNDGEYEYWRTVPVEASSEAEAVEAGLASDRQWTKEDYREVTCEGVKEIPMHDFQVLKKYL